MQSSSPFSSFRTLRALCASSLLGLPACGEHERPSVVAIFGLMAFLLNFIPTVGSIVAWALPLPVVIISPAIEAAFCSAVRDTLVGSRMPMPIMSPYSALAALKP